MNKSSRNGLLWLKGKPGSGKSVLIKHAFLRASTKLGESQYRTAAFFFNSRGNELERSTLGLFRSLLYQLLPTFPRHLQRFCEIRNERVHDDPWYEPQLRSIFYLLISDLTEPTIIVFIDALDECRVESIRPLVSFLYEMTEVARSNMKVCISSRHFPNITVGTCPSIAIENHNGHDIALYVEQKLQFGMVTADPGRRLLQENLVSKSSGVFLWVALMLDDILARWDDGDSIRSLLNQLDKVPKGLDTLFRHLMTSHFWADKALTRRFFRWALLSTKPLRLYEWHHIMAFIRHPTLGSLEKWRSSEIFTETDDQLEKTIKKISYGLVEVQNIKSELCEDSSDVVSVHARAGSLDSEQGGTRIVQVIHESVREFFLRGPGFDILSDSSKSGHVGQGHIYIIHTCLNYIDIIELDALIQARSMGTSNETNQLREGQSLTMGEPGIAHSPDTHLNETQSQTALMQLDDKSDGEIDNHADSTVNIFRWLQTLSTDLTTYDRVAADRSPSHSSTGFSTLGQSQVLEDYPALLFYALTQLFSHARLAEAEGADPVSIITRLLNTRLWDRWVALNEELPPGTKFVSCCYSQGLNSWARKIMEMETFERIISAGEQYKRFTTEMRRIQSLASREVHGAYTQRPRGVASFSSASSHSSDITLRLS
ncbi:hypothetical protein BX600DRAFT_476427 [Xylariales sp. PMI_506]|nr:hypothetical protein BX600DRAFT_476427 [Xylariales sp. PMI_506]